MRSPGVYDYAIHDLLRIRSDRRLPELVDFRVNMLEGAPDIRVRVTADPTTGSDNDTVSYREALGRFGFQIAIDRREYGTEVRASPLIGLSPHVLYTNVVEPLVRWSLVRKGHALMHGACLSFDDRALFITARTDTGKTTTILNTLKAQRDACRFLSDDMTIFAPDGTVYAYAKPLTISRHTVQAIGGAPLGGRERLALGVQSRLHSKSGRATGMRLSRAGAPAATLSAIVQRLIPPPKFMVDRLVPGTAYGQSAQLTGIVVIERGEQGERAVPPDEVVDTLLRNAEDAYGFPPYPALAERLERWLGEDLSALERDIVARAVQGVPAVNLSSDRFDWHERLPGVAASASVLPAPTAAVPWTAPADGARPA